MKTQALKIVAVQENPVVGDIDNQIAIIQKYLNDESDADLIVFPECFLTGYPLGDLVMRPGFLEEVAAAQLRIRAMVHEADGPAVLYGTPMPNGDDNLPFNGALFEAKGHVQRFEKVELPNFDVFDERRTFASGSIDDVSCLEFKGVRIGVAICEDIWHDRVPSKIGDNMPDMTIVLNGSPWEVGKASAREARAHKAFMHGTGPVLYLNQWGGQDELVFDGGSFLMDGGRVFRAKAFEADCLRVDTWSDERCAFTIQATNGTIGTYSGEDGLEFDQEFEKDLNDRWNACVLGLKDFVRKTGVERVFIGLSGGLDSALVATMAVDALGPDNVVCVRMPSKYTSQESLDLAKELADNLKCHLADVPIDGAVLAASLDNLPAAENLASALDVKKPAYGLMEENMQARMRGLSLMAMANALGGIVLTTGNKSEMAVGYATLYGDMAGGYNPLKSIYKSVAFKMAAQRNLLKDPLPVMEGEFIRNPIPEAIITRVPTAELSEGQKDSDALGSYDELDFVLENLIENAKSAEEVALLMSEQGAPADLAVQVEAFEKSKIYVERIAKLVRNAQHKRVQSPPGVKINTTDFGLGWRYPIAGRYNL